MANAKRAKAISEAVAAAAGNRSGRINEEAKSREGGRERRSMEGRIPLGSGSNLSVPQAIIDEAKEKEMFLYWAIDDHSLDQYKMAGYEVYSDAEGNPIRRPTKDSENFHVLMWQPMEWHEEDKARQKSSTNANLMEAAEGLESGQYVPDGKTYAVQKDRTLLPNR